MNVVQMAASWADRPEHEGAGYLLRVTLRSGTTHRGGVMRHDADVLVLDVWKVHETSGDGPSGDLVFIAIDAVQACEIEF